MTKASAIYAATRHVEVVQQLLGHVIVATTSAYLGIEQAKALDIAKNHKNLKKMLIRSSISATSTAQLPQALLACPS